jgi:hypothetical protein
VPCPRKHALTDCLRAAAPQVIMEIMKEKLRLVLFGGEICQHCQVEVDYSFKVKDGCLEECAKAIAERLRIE